MPSDGEFYLESNEACNSIFRRSYDPFLSTWFLDTFEIYVNRLQCRSLVCIRNTSSANTLQNLKKKNKNLVYWISRFD